MLGIAEVWKIKDGRGEGGVKRIFIKITRNSLGDSTGLTCISRLVDTGEDQPDECRRYYVARIPQQGLKQGGKFFQLLCAPCVATCMSSSL